MDKLKEEVLKQLQQFYNVEQGNRVTIYNFTSLVNQISNTIDNLKPKEKESKK